MRFPDLVILTREMPLAMSGFRRTVWSLFGWRLIFMWKQ